MALRAGSSTYSMSYILRLFEILLSCLPALTEHSTVIVADAL